MESTFDQYWAYFITQVNNVQQKNVFCYVPTAILEGVERELLIGSAYEPKRPSYKSNAPETRLAIRRVEPSLEVYYRNMRIRCGKTNLSIADRQTHQNLSAIFAVYLGESESIS